MIIIDDDDVYITSVYYAICATTITYIRIQQCREKIYSFTMNAAVAPLYTYSTAHFSNLLLLPLLLLSLLSTVCHHTGCFVRCALQRVAFWLVHTFDLVVWSLTVVLYVDWLYRIPLCVYIHFPPATVILYFVCYIRPIKYGPLF